jgi:hypothetical protein
MSKSSLKALSLGVAMAAATFGLSTGASASTLTFSLTQDHCTGTCGTAPFGSVTVSSISSTEVSVTETLNAGESFRDTGAGDPILFDLTGNPAISSLSVTGLPSGYSFASSAPGSQDGSGSWEYGVDCSSCGTGTTLSFDITLASGITPSSFIQNGNSLFFASDIMGTNGNTGDVGAPNVSATPLPAALPLFIGGLGMMGLFGRRRKREASVAA